MKRRTLTREEKALWAHVQRAVQPMPGRRRDEIPLETPAQAARVFAAAVAPSPSKPVMAQPPPLAPIERGLLRRVKRGARDIEGVLDLHGLTQAAAHESLLRFLHRKQRDGASLVIVVTGKGALGSYDDPDRERGVLRRVVPHWLRLPDLRNLVIGFETAAAHHGGEGALYVRLRRARAFHDS